MSSFVGRTIELDRLSRRLDAVRRTQRGELIAMRGRRRVGKSRLVEEFSRSSGSPYVFFVATRQSPERELERFEEAVAASDLPVAEVVRAGTSFTSWEAALALAASNTDWSNPSIVVIDELPYLIDKEPGLEAVLQKAWDRTLQRSAVLLILIGSDIATMEALAQERRPLFDRAREMVVRPLSPPDIGDLLRIDPAEAFDAYLAIGGFPELAISWGAGRDLWAFLEEAFDDPASLLVVSAERALSAEFPTDAHARTVLSAIGSGERAFKAIQARAGLPTTTLDRALGVLARKRVARRITPYSGKSGAASPRWVILDPYLRFWLRFVEPNIELLERDRGHLGLERVCADWEAYRGRAIEPVIRESIERLLPEERFGNASYVGSYWTRDGRVEVDLVGGDTRHAPTTVRFVGSIKWRQAEPFGSRDLARLHRDRGAVPGVGEETPLVGVSRSGFRDAPVDVALDPAELLAAWRRRAS